MVQACHVLYKIVWLKTFSEKQTSSTGQTLYRSHSAKCRRSSLRPIVSGQLHQVSVTSSSYKCTDTQATGSSCTMIRARNVVISQTINKCLHIRICLKYFKNSKPTCFHEYHSESKHIISSVGTKRNLFKYKLVDACISFLLSLYKITTNNNSF